MSSLKLNKNQESAKTCRKNIVVSAGAGSGKTAVLSERFIYLIEEGYAHADEILTITFTRKATSEMKERIYKKLLSSKRLQDNMLNQKGFNLKDELNRFSNSTISTIDSFCSSIVRLDSVRYGFTSDFTVMETEDIKEDINRLANSFLEKNRNSEAIRYLIKNKGSDSVIELFSNLGIGFFNIVKPINPEKVVADFIEKIKKKYNLYKMDLKEAAKDLYVLLSESDGSISGNVKEKNNNSLKMTEDAFNKCDYKEIANIKFTLTTGKNADKDYNTSLKTKKEKLDYAASFCDMCNSVINNEPFYKEIYTLITEFEKLVFSKKRELNALVFNDVMKLSIDILKTNKKIRKLYKEKYKYIMIDEFQDNNEDNKNLLYLLAEKIDTDKTSVPGIEDLEPEKIFLVGDEKQSIYGFRGADVSVFKDLTKEIGNNIELNENYRSNPSLIVFFNYIFKKIMESENGVKRPFEADFKPLIEPKEKNVSSLKEKNGRVLFNYCYLKKKENNKDETNNEKNRTDFLDSGNLNSYNTKSEEDNEVETSVQAEANSIADLIYKITKSKEYENSFLIPKKEKDDNGNIIVTYKRPEEKDIAILLRKLSHQSCYEKALKLKGISYNVSEAKGLATEAVFNDFYSFLQIMLYPDDSLSVLSYLKGPFCRVKDSEIKDCFFNVKSSEDYVFKNLKDCYKLEILETQRKCKYLRLTQLLDYIYYNLGYRNFLITSYSNQVYAEHYNYLFSLACKLEKKGFGLVEFLDYIRNTIKNDIRLENLTVLQEESEGVNIMTIHKSKGLEFPVVIVADMGSGNLGQRGGFGSFDINMDKEIDVPFFNSVDFYKKKNEKSFVNPLNKMNKDLTNMIEEAETKRLFYVACTRAENILILSSVITDSALKNTDSTGNRVPDTMLKMFIKSTDFDYDNDDSEGVIYEKSLNSGEIKIESVKFSVAKSKAENRECLTDNVFLSNLKEIYNSNVIQVEIDSSKDVFGVSELDDDLKENITDYRKNPLSEIKSDDIIEKHNLFTDFGIATHDYIENLIVKSGENSFGFSDLSEKENSILYLDIQMLAENFLHSNLYDKIKNYNLFVEKEFYYYDTALDKLLNGRIDLLAVGVNDIYVVDFKTDKFKNPEIYRTQLESYKKAVSSLYPDKTIKTVLLYLRDVESPVYL